MRVFNTRQMRDADRRTIEEIGIPSIVLMENAGRQAVAAMEAAYDIWRLGLDLDRIESLNDDPAFVRGLVELVRETVSVPST